MFGKASKAVMVAMLGGALLGSGAQAALPVGAKAPDFETRGALAGKVFSVKLSDALKKGPVVLYFFPAAFTKGCTAETKEFADQADAFKKAGATVIGMSADPVDVLQRFSTEACGSKFAVASAGPRLITNYDVALKADNPAFAGKTDRTSYVISPAGRIVYVHSALDYRDHVKNTLAAVQSMASDHKH
ncbi:MULTISPECIES: peroxiredoxin [unclassified Sphingobium]|uniref:peroxiredoxin n=1 Tax=unclassified Sphingobium TaxID=2611147 RepID=UPI0022242E60|nr:MULTISPECIES: peroxiredoxin [unclassified Sphingobium]MCW2380976.1 peroxiredoxin [Sphingobium sp. B2D3B]MCW2398918.1 peroxiredoxin [Sphingobium sp. B2D3C]